MKDPGNSMAQKTSTHILSEMKHPENSMARKTSTRFLPEMKYTDIGSRKNYFRLYIYAKSEKTAANPGGLRSSSPDHLADFFIA